MDAKILTTDPAGRMRLENVLDVQYADPETASAGAELSVGLNREWTGNRFLGGLRASGLLDPPSPTSSSLSPWYVAYGGQRTITVVSEYGPLHSGRPRLYAVQLDENGEFDRAFAGGPIDVGAEPPVLAQLGDQGRIAAAKGANLSYRFAAGQPRQGTRVDAIMIPMGATHLQVERPDHGPAIVDTQGGSRSVSDSVGKRSTSFTGGHKG